MLNNGMTPQNALFLDENGKVHSLITLIKDISTGTGTSKIIQLQKGETHIQWKYSDEEAWNDLIAIAELKGEQGIQGVKGATGVDGFGTQEQYNDIINRLEALESSNTPA